MRQVIVDGSYIPKYANIEFVERKGVGHPDTIADGIAELASIKYSKYCLQEFGVILHHNFDKVAVLGGRARFDWRSGDYDRPLRIIFAGRASFSFAGRTVPVQDILEEAAQEQLGEVLRDHTVIPTKYSHETTDSSMYSRWFSPESRDDLPDSVKPVSNDTAFLTSSSPLSPLEDLVLTTERMLWDYDWVGTDIKVLAFRRAQSIDVAVTVPALVGTLLDANDYRRKAEPAKHQLLSVWRSRLGEQVNLTFRALDDVAGIAHPSYQDCYVNLSGSAIDYGEDGLVGRGNGRGGIISSCTGSGNEAYAGKNPAYMVGKVAGWIADETAAGVGWPVRITLAYRRGSAYDAPMVAIAHVGDEAHREAAESALERIGKRPWTPALVDGEYYRIRKE